MAGTGTKARGDHNLRKRKTNEPNDANADAVEPMDEDEQAKMIDQLRADSLRQSESMLRIFHSMCIIAAVVLILSVLYLDQWYLASPLRRKKGVGFVRALSMAHGLSSAVLHYLSPMMTNPQQTIHMIVRVAVVIDALIAVNTLWAIRLQLREDDEKDDETLLWMHYSIVMSNVFVVFAAIMLRWDGESTDKALDDLRQAQYRFKSL